MAAERAQKVCPACGDRYEADVLFCPKDGTPIPSKKGASFRTQEDPYIGIELAGQIRVKSLLGIGSMGRVYRAFQAGVERDVAVKILHRELSAQKELVRRFHREAKVASRLTQPNVVQVLMTGTVPLVADLRVGGELYLVMEYLDGISLMSALAASEPGTLPGEHGALPLPRSLRIVLQVCDAVGDAHAQGIVHRDIKPENVMLVRRGEEADYVKVLDFGIARLDWMDRSVSTQQGLIFGTAKYISPEGAEGRTVGPPADVYSIATVLYECLAGRSPFEGESPVALLVQHTHAPPPELRSITRSSYVPEPIASVIMQNLAKSPDERAPDARAFGRELVAAIRASGLDPEELLSPSSLLGKSNTVVRLASKERTRALLDFGDVRARLAELEPPLGASLEGPLEGSSELEPSRGSVGPVGSTRSGSRPPPSSRGPATRPGSTLEPRNADGPTSRASATRLEAPSEAALGGAELESQRPGSTVLGDVEALGGEVLDEPSAGERQLSRHAASGPASPRVERSRPFAARAALYALVAAAVAAIAVVVVGRELGLLGQRPEAGSVEAALDATRDAMRRSAWTSPPGENVRDLTQRALEQHPGEPRLLALKKQAAQVLVAEALGRKYAGARADAAALAKVALELWPGYSTAERLLLELSGPEVGATLGEALDAAPAPAPSAKPRATRPLPSALPAATSTEARPALPPPSARPAAPSAKPSEGAPELPPPPPQLPVEHQPPPGSSGPWL